MSNEEYWITHEATREWREILENYHKALNEYGESTRELNRAYYLMRDYARKVLLKKYKEK